MLMWSILLIAVTYLFTISSGGCAESGTSTGLLAVPSHTLDSLRAAVARLDNELELGRRHETDLLGRLDLAEQRFSLHDQLLREQRRLVKDLRDSIETMEAEIVRREDDLTVLGSSILVYDDRRREIGESMSHTMLTDRRLATWTSLEFLLGSDSWLELMNRRLVIRRIQSAQDAEIRAAKLAMDTLIDAESQVLERTTALKWRKDQLAARRLDAESIERNYSIDAAGLLRGRSELKSQISSVKNDRELLEGRREEIIAAQAAIQDLIERISRGEPISGVPLSMLKGLLPWPVSGRVVGKFGLQKNAELATVTENPGIELAASPDAEVLSVAEGRVSSVSWLRGFGNVCIVEHPGSFYTVYARLGQVRVAANEMLKPGQSIGYPGFDPAAEDYRVHFEVWSGRDKKDPLEWLQPR